MNGSGIHRYSSDFEKKSKKLRLLFPCQVCGENDFCEKEVHHIDGDKKNSNLNNLIVLCKECHFLLHQGRVNIHDKVLTQKGPDSVLVGRRDIWISKDSKVKIILVDHATAMTDRKLHVKGWIIPGACNMYIGVVADNLLCGIMGFKNEEIGTYDLMLKADTVDSGNKYSIDLLLYLLRTKEVKLMLEKKFNREIKTIYSMCFTRNSDISRYRKHGTMVKKVPVDGGFNISYIFKCGEIPSIKSAVAEFIQKHKDL